MTPVRPLTLRNKTGNGSPAIEDLIAVQTAILTSNATVLGAVGQMQTDMGQRLDRSDRETAQSLDVIEGQVTVLDGRLGRIEEARRTDTALDEQAKALAAKTATQAKETATDARTQAADNNAVAQAHSMGRNQRWGILIAAIAGIGGLLIAALTLLLRLIGAL